MYRRLYFIGIAAYAVLLVFSILFYKERIIILDTAFTLFHIVNEHFFSIQVYRFGDVFAQSFPLVASTAGLPFHSVVLSYSVGYAVYFAVCYLVAGSLLKQYELALVILLLNLLFVSETFYWTTSQLPESIALLMVTFAFIHTMQLPVATPLGVAILVAAGITLAFFHPLVAIVLLFSVLFFKEQKGRSAQTRFLNMLVVIFVLALFVKAVAFHTPYERNSMSGMKNFITLFPDYFTLFSNKRFAINCITKYYWIPVLFSGIVIFYIKKRKWNGFFAFLFFFFGYLFLINVSYPGKNTSLFYLESMYLPLGIFLALPFVFYLLPLLDKKKMALPLFVLIVLTGIVRIYFAHIPYTARLDYERKYLDKYGERKVFIKAGEADKEVLQMLWGTPYEFLLLSECERNKPASVIIDEDPELRPWAAYVRNAMIVNWNVYKYSELNDRYFQLTDTITAYGIIE